MYETLGLSGEPFVGGDIGGFIGRTDAELMTRWFQVGPRRRFYWMANGFPPCGPAS